METHSFWRVLCDLTETLRKLCVSTKFPHQEIGWNYGVLCIVELKRQSLWKILIMKESPVQIQLIQCQQFIPFLNKLWTFYYRNVLMKYCLKNIDSRLCVGLLVRRIETRIWLEANFFSFHNLTELQLPAKRENSVSQYICSSLRIKVRNEKKW